MILTQDEAKKWAVILKGFAEGKKYKIPFVYDNNGNVIEYTEITDFDVNPQCPTIQMTPSRSMFLIDPDMIIEL